MNPGETIEQYVYRIFQEMPDNSMPPLEEVMHDASFRDLCYLFDRAIRDERAECIAICERVKTAMIMSSMAYRSGRRNGAQRCQDDIEQRNYPLFFSQLNNMGG
jgi:hypothetical protein